MSAEAGLSLARRLWIYQAERFPLLKSGVLLAAFSAASLSVSAHLGGRSAPGIWIYLAAWFCIIAIFFQMRVCDEFKDHEEDSRFRPERPVPRGLVTLGLLRNLGLGAGAVMIAASLGVDGRLLGPLALVWVWLALMTAEFGAPAWLKARPVLYLLSHMLIMPLIDLFVTAMEWLPAAGRPPAGLGGFLALSFVNGCVLEIGRKIWAPQSERPGVESYSGLWGPQRATRIWMGAVTLAWAALLWVGWAMGSFALVALIGTASALAALMAGLGFVNSATPERAKRLDLMAGLWVLLCYGAAGFAPFLTGGGS